MKLFKKKDKKLKKARKGKSGCLSKLAIIAMFLVVLVVGVVNGINNVSRIYGAKIEQVMGYINALNEEVDPAEIILNPIKEYRDFANAAVTFGFNGYGSLGNVLTLTEDSMTYDDNVYGALISNHINKETALISLGEFSITSQNTIRAVYVYDLKALGDALAEAGDIIPNKLYIIVNYEYTIVDIMGGLKQVEYTVIDQQLNKLDKKVSEEILSYMGKVDKADVQNPLDTYEDVVFDVINTIAIKTQSVVSLDTGSITYTKLSAGA